MMNFGKAIEAAKAGEKIARKGWNGKGMWVIYVAGSRVKLREGTPYFKALANEVAEDDGMTEILPHFDMWTINATGRRAMLCGWLASQSDMDAEDWVIVK